jgi:hypothetical protein
MYRLVIVLLFLATACRAVHADLVSAFFIGNSLMQDATGGYYALSPPKTVHAQIWGSQTLPGAYANPSSTIAQRWDVSLNANQYDALVVQPYFPSTLGADKAVINEWLELQPDAVLVLHTGWPKRSIFEPTVHGTFDGSTMVQNRLYIDALKAELSLDHPDLEIRVNDATAALDLIFHDIENGTSIYTDFGVMWRDDLHMSIGRGTYLQNAMMAKTLGWTPPPARVWPTLTQADVDYLDGVVSRVTAVPEASSFLLVGAVGVGLWWATGKRGRG